MKMHAIGLVFAMVAPLSARGQCTPEWQAGNGIPGAAGFVYAATMWDSDGAGGQDPVLVIGGDFQIAGDTVVNDLAMWDGSKWQSVGGGVSRTSGNNSVVRALAVLPTGELVAAGAFSFAGEVAASNIAKWNGVAWAPLGSGTDGFVRTMVKAPNGDLIAGGAFLNAGGSPASHIARWDGHAWSALGDGVNLDVYAMTVLPDGTLAVAGDFTAAGGSPAERAT